MIVCCTNIRNIFFLTDIIKQRLFQEIWNKKITEKFIVKYIFIQNSNYTFWIIWNPNCWFISRNIIYGILYISVFHSNWYFLIKWILNFPSYLREFNSKIKLFVKSVFKFHAIELYQLQFLNKIHLKIIIKNIIIVRIHKLLS